MPFDAIPPDIRKLPGPIGLQRSAIWHGVCGTAAARSATTESLCYSRLEHLNRSQAFAGPLAACYSSVEIRRSDHPRGVPAP